MNEPSFHSITGSYKLDVILFVSLLFILFLSNDRIRVYNTYTAGKVTVYSLSPGGNKAVFKTPSFLEGEFVTTSSADITIKRIENKIKNYVKTSSYIKNVIFDNPDNKLVWVIHYSNNSRKLDREHKFITDKDLIINEFSY